MNPAGQVTENTLGNGIITTRAFDAVTHLLTSVQSGEGGGTGVQNMSFLYDPVGNVTQRQNNGLGLTENFYYDGDNRLSYSTLNGTQNLSLTYDAMGNITNRSDVASNATWTYDPTRKHEVTEAGSTAYEYTYDANGNMSSRAGGAISWTSYNYPSVIKDNANGMTVDLNYGPDRGVWLETTQTLPLGWGPGQTTETYRLGSLMDMVIGGSGDSDRDYIYAGNQPVAVDERTSSSNSFYYFQTDQQGSISGITNASGQIVVNENFTAYGARRNPSTWSGSPSSTDLATIAGITQHGYTFQRELGQQMGLNDMVGRVEDAVTGRFLSADPTSPNAADPQDWNDYSYTENNPLTYVDPTGFFYVVDCWTDFCNSGASSSSNSNGGNGNGNGGRPVSGGSSQSQLNYDSTASITQQTQQAFSNQVIFGTPDPFPSLGSLGNDGISLLPEDQPLNQSFLGLDQLLAMAWHWTLSEIGCKSTVCQLAMTALPAILDPAAAEGAGAAGEFSLYDSAGGLKGLNTNVTADEFSANLQANGYTAGQTTGSNGAVTVLQNGQGSTWTIYTRGSTNDMGAQFIGPNGQFLKYNLGVQDLPLPGP